MLHSLKRYAARLKAESKRPLLVLVVDDDQAVRDFVDRVLRDAGYRTMVAGSGPDAIKLAAKEPIDLLLTDVNMPQMTGDELARRLRHDEPSLKVLYLTGFSDQLFQEKTTLWQDEAYLEKPCTIAGLTTAMRRRSCRCCSGTAGGCCPPTRRRRCWRATTAARSSSWPSTPARRR